MRTCFDPKSQLTTPFAVLCAFILPTVLPAQAFDCKLAATPSEKAICSNPAVLAADEKLNKIFGELRTSLNKAQSSGLLTSQKRWVKDRDSCAEAKDDTVPQCIKDKTDARLKFLSATPQSGSGTPGTLVPYFRIENGGKGKTKVDIQIYKFANPSTTAQQLFNSEVDKLIIDVPQPDASTASSEYFEYSVSMSLDYVSPQLISAQTGTETFLGGPHPNIQSMTINIDVAKGKLAQFKDFLDGKAVKDVSDNCLKQILQQKKENDGSQTDTTAAAVNELAGKITKVTSNLELWTFDASKASIQYDRYVVGAYSEGAFICEIPYSQLRPLVKPGFPLP